MKKTTIIFLLINIICLHAVAVHSAQTKDSIPLDPTIRYGKLNNGLSYYIKSTSDRSSQIDMRFVVRVGSAMEETSESEFAHIMEHLAFTAGKHISRGKSSELFDRIGMGFSQLNGHCYDYFTDYKMVVSAKNREAINTALLFFHDIIWGLQLNEELIDMERIAVLNEIYDQNWDAPVLLNFMEREIQGASVIQPKNYRDHLKTFDPDSLIKFYKKWYRPDLMSLVIIGDIENMGELEHGLKAKFSNNITDRLKIPAKDKHREYMQQAQKFIKRPYETALTDSKSGNAIFSLYKRLKKRSNNNSVEGLRENLIQTLFIDMLNGRFNEKQSAYNVSFKTRSKIIGPAIALKLHIAVKGGPEKEALKKVMETLRVIEIYGFSQEEFEKAKQDLLVSITNEDTTTIHYWKNEIIDHFVYGTPLPQNKQMLLGKILKDLTSADFNDAIRTYVEDQPDDIVVLAPSGHTALSISEKEIREWLLEVDRTPLHPYTPPQVPKELMDTSALDKLTEISSKKINSKIPGTIGYVLNNGVKVILKSYPQPSSVTPNKKNTISFHGYTYKGAYHFPEEDYYSAINSSAIVKNVGLGRLDKFQLSNYLDHINFKGHVDPYVGNTETGIRGYVNHKDLETAMQLVYLYFKAPNISNSDIAFKDWKKTQVEYFKNYVPDINYEDFENTIREVLPDNEFLPRGSKALKGIERTNLYRAIEIYNQLFSNAGEYTFMLAGDFVEDEVLKLCRRYLGNLKAIEGKKLKTEVEPSLRSMKLGCISRTVSLTQPLETEMIHLIHVTKTDELLDWKETIKIDVLRRIMSELLMRKLRFESEKGGVYAAGAGANYVKSHYYNEISIRLSCLPKDTVRMIEESKQVVDTLLMSPVDETLLENMINGMLHYTKEVDSYSGTLNKMHDYDRYGLSWVDGSQKKKYIKSLTPKDIWKIANKYLKKDPLVFKMTSANNKE